VKKEKYKQIVLSIIAVCLIFVGYLNYNYNEENYVEVATEANNTNIGDAQLVNSESVNNEENIDSLIVPNEVHEETAEINRDDYFTKTRLERDIMYSEMITTYQKMIDSPDVSQSQKTIATGEIANITSTKNAIMISENLIKNKNFEDVVILVNKEIVNVIVKCSNLNIEQVAKIQNIVTRELDTKIENISISNKY